MSVFYKFKSSKDFDTINIEGSHIPLGKLKQLIVQQKKLAKSGGDFDLVVTNAQSNEGLFLDKNIFFYLHRRCIFYVLYRLCR